MVEVKGQGAGSQSRFVLSYTPQGLCLIDHHFPQFKPLLIDYSDSSLVHRQRHSFRQEGLAKAIGIKAGYRPRVIDATAGVGQDAAMMASWGCSVQMIERSPLLAALLEDALSRAPWLQKHLTLIKEDAKAFLQQLSPEAWPDVIYVDPMFPERVHRASPKKEMQMLRALVGSDDDTETLLAIALTRAKKRVVLKRHRLDPLPTSRQPSYQWCGQSTRFDIFLIESH